MKESDPEESFRGAGAQTHAFRKMDFKTTQGEWLNDDPPIHLLVTLCCHLSHCLPISPQLPPS